MNFTKDGQPVAQKEGDGSLPGKEVNKDTPIDIKLATCELTAATNFHAKDTDTREKESKFDRFWKINNGIEVVRTPSVVFKGQDTRQERDKRQLIECLNSVLGVSDEIKERAVTIALSTDGRQFNKIGGLEALCLGSIVLAQNRWWKDQYQDALNDDNADFQEIRSHRIQEWTDSEGEKIVSQLANESNIDLSQALTLLKQ